MNYSEKLLQRKVRRSEILKKYKPGGSVEGDEEVVNYPMPTDFKPQWVKQVQPTYPSNAPVQSSAADTVTEEGKVWVPGEYTPGRDEMGDFIKGTTVVGASIPLALAAPGAIAATRAAYQAASPAVKLGLKTAGAAANSYFVADAVRRAPETVGNIKESYSNGSFLQAADAIAGAVLDASIIGGTAATIGRKMIKPVSNAFRYAKKQATAGSRLKAAEARNNELLSSRKAELESLEKEISGARGRANIDFDLLSDVRNRYNGIGFKDNRIVYSELGQISPISAGDELYIRNMANQYGIPVEKYVDMINRGSGELYNHAVNKFLARRLGLPEYSKSTNDIFKELRSFYQNEGISRSQEQLFFKYAKDNGLNPYSKKVQQQFLEKQLTSARGVSSTTLQHGKTIDDALVGIGDGSGGRRLGSGNYNSNSLDLGKSFTNGEGEIGVLRLNVDLNKKPLKAIRELDKKILNANSPAPDHIADDFFKSIDPGIKRYENFVRPSTINERKPEILRKHGVVALESPYLSRSVGDVRQVSERVVIGDKEAKLHDIIDKIKVNDGVTGGRLTAKGAKKSSDLFDPKYNTDFDKLLEKYDIIPSVDQYTLNDLYKISGRAKNNLGVYRKVADKKNILEKAIRLDRKGNDIRHLATKRRYKIKQYGDNTGYIVSSGIVTGGIGFGISKLAKSYANSSSRRRKQQLEDNTENARRQIDRRRIDNSSYAERLLRQKYINKTKRLKFKGLGEH